jgi:hypothetical protein
MEGTPDLAKIVGAIMENPALMEQISSIAKGSTEKEPREAEDTPKTEQTAAVKEEPAPAPKQSDRARLLRAMKPYLSESRARALDSMLVVADILDGMRGR